ncbi:MAG: menaquinone biosynthesis protein [Bacteroidetes bacterium]|nr:menaquinone biosynthesis protein [Bacteroidota bacterium]
MLRISAVSYINAKPFVYGIQNSGFLKDYSLSLDVPSVCAEKLRTNQVDIGLAPIAIIPELEKHFIIPGFCIGANGPVKTVMLYSEVPLKEIKNIFLDYQSRTSVMLVQILAKHSWKVSPTWIQATKGYEENIKGTTAGVIIGDRNFSLSQKFNHVYDLSEEWRNFTGLPFVFACWVANKELDEDVAAALYKSLRFGVENIDKVVKEVKDQYDEKIIWNYLNNCIHYSFDKPKEDAMGLFLKLVEKIR